MSESNKRLIIEARTIVYMLYSIAAGSSNWDEDIPREEMIHLLQMVRMRLDALVGAD